MSLWLIFFLHIILTESSHSVLSRVFFIGAFTSLPSPSSSRFNAVSPSHFSAPPAAALALTDMTVQGDKGRVIMVH